MPSEDNKILKYNPGEKSLKVPFIIYVDLECLLQKINTCQNNPEKSYTEKKAKHKLPGYSLVKCCLFDNTKTTVNYYIEKDSMKVFYKDLRDDAMKIINYEKKEMIPLTNEEKESYENQDVCYIYEKNFCANKNNKKEFKSYCKVRDHCHYTGKYRGAAHSSCNLRYKVPKELAKEFKGNFECLGENTEKYITLSVPIKKEHDNGKITIYKLKFIDSCRSMNISLSSLVDNLSEINKKESENEFIDNMRSTISSLSQSIDKVTEVDKKIAQVDNMRFMIASLSQSIDKVSHIDKKNSWN